MRIAILGNGSLGTTLAGYLARAGNDVTLIVRPERLAELRDKAVRVSGLADFAASVRWASGADAPNADLLAITVKTFQTEAALAGLGDATFGAVLSFQNGLRKNELLAARFPDHVLGATTQVGGELLAPAHARHVLDGMTYVGERDGRVSERATAVAAAFRDAGLPTEARSDIRSAEWSKLCQYAGAALMAAASRQLLHAIYLDPDLATLYLRVVREAATIARAHGVEPGDFPGFPIASLSQTPFTDALAQVAARGADMRARGITSVRSSLLVALEAVRPTELEDTAGWLVAAANSRGTAVPTLETLYQLVRATQSAAPPE